MRSMTGFGAGSAGFSDGTVHVELKSVNNRYFELRARSSAPFGDVSSELDEQLRPLLER